MINQLVCEFHAANSVCASFIQKFSIVLPILTLTYFGFESTLKLVLHLPIFTQ